MKIKKKITFTVLIILLIVLILPALIVAGSGSGKIRAKDESDQSSFSSDQIRELKAQKADCILVLGAAVKPDGTPSKMLADRLKTGIALYKAGAAGKLLLSGDNGSVEYNEVKAMKNFALAAGVRGKDIFLDHAGFSTYESMYRAREIFMVKSIIVVTQTYHEYRSLYDASRLGMKAAGVSSDQKRYGGQLMRDIREYFAIEKDFFKCIAKPEPTYLGEQIPITGSGKKTW